MPLDTQLQNVVQAPYVNFSSSQRLLRAQGRKEKGMLLKDHCQNNAKDYLLLN
jgi:hypothetical protein